MANRNREEAQQQQEQEQEQGQGQGAGVGSHAMPKMNSTLRLAARLEEIQQERPAAAAVAKVIAAAKPSRGLVNFSMEDRKYGALTTIEILPEETGPTADLPPVSTVQYSTVQYSTHPHTYYYYYAHRHCQPPPASSTASALLPYSRLLYTYLVRDLTRVLRLVVVCVYVAHGVSSGTNIRRRKQSIPNGLSFVPLRCDLRYLPCTPRSGRWNTLHHPILPGV